MLKQEHNEWENMLVPCKRTMKDKIEEQQCHWQKVRERG